MPCRIIPFANQEIYHVFNRGVAKLPIFADNLDRKRLLKTLAYYQYQGPKPRYSFSKRGEGVETNIKIVEILCYCLMPNHFHLILKQLKPNGISEFMNKVGNSYTKYYNTRHQRVGPLLQGQFKAVHVETDEQLIHLSRYIHLNPLTAFLIKNLNGYPWSSYLEYLGQNTYKLCNVKLVLSLFKTSGQYQQFVLDQANSIKKNELIEPLLID